MISIYKFLHRSVYLLTYIKIIPINVKSSKFCRVSKLTLKIVLRRFSILLFFFLIGRLVSKASAIVLLYAAVTCLEWLFVRSGFIFRSHSQKKTVFIVFMRCALWFLCLLIFPVPRPRSYLSELCCRNIQSLLLKTDLDVYRAKHPTSAKHDTIQTPLNHSNTIV